MAVFCLKLLVAENLLGKEPILTQTGLVGVFHSTKTFQIRPAPLALQVIYLRRLVLLHDEIVELLKPIFYFLWFELAPSICLFKQSGRERPSQRIFA